MVTTEEQAVRTKIKEYREKRWFTREQFGKQVGISKYLVGMIEEGDVTHPKIAQRIAEVVGLTDLETEFLMPIIHRSHGEDYEPNRYVHPVDFQMQGR